MQVKCDALQKCIFAYKCIFAQLNLLQSKMLQIHFCTAFVFCCAKNKGSTKNKNTIFQRKHACKAQLHGAPLIEDQLCHSMRPSSVRRCDRRSIVAKMHDAPRNHDAYSVIVRSTITIHFVN